MGYLYFFYSRLTSQPTQRTVQIRVQTLVSYGVRVYAVRIHVPVQVGVRVHIQVWVLVDGQGQSQGQPTRLKLVLDRGRDSTFHGKMRVEQLIGDS